MVSTLHSHDSSHSLPVPRMGHVENKPINIKKMEEDARIHRLICPRKKPQAEPRFLGMPKRLNFNDQ